MHGLLKIRGEISKSDVVAGLLATKCVQEKVAEVLQVSWWLKVSFLGKKKQVGFLQPCFFCIIFGIRGQFFFKGYAG